MWNCVCGHFLGIEVKVIDAMYPETEQEYNEFERALKTKISFFEVSSIWYDVQVTKICK